MEAFLAANILSIIATALNLCSIVLLATAWFKFRRSLRGLNNAAMTLAARLKEPKAPWSPSPPMANNWELERQRRLRAGGK